jgi:hypothetical protein
VSVTTVFPLFPFAIVSSFSISSCFILVMSFLSILFLILLLLLTYWFMFLFSLSYIYNIFTVLCRVCLLQTPIPVVAILSIFLFLMSIICEPFTSHTQFYCVKCMFVVFITLQ